MSQALCGAKTRSGGTCRQPRMLGARRCRMHGSAAPRARAAAQRRMAEQKALQAVEGAGVAPLGDPVEQLRELASEALRLKDYFAERLEALESLRYMAHGTGGEQLRSEVALYERALDRSQRFLHDLARLGLDERQVRISEAQVVLVAGVLERVLGRTELGLDSARLMIARTLLVEELEADA